jgi:hypothetical protein
MTDPVVRIKIRKSNQSPERQDLATTVTKGNNNERIIHSHYKKCHSPFITPTDSGAKK